MFSGEQVYKFIMGNLHGWSERFLPSRLTPISLEDTAKEFGLSKGTFYHYLAQEIVPYFQVTVEKEGGGGRGGGRGGSIVIFREMVLGAMKPRHYQTLTSENTRN